MQIKNLATTKVGTRVRVSAEVVYEDSERPTREVYIETTEQYAEGLTQNPHAFLVASIMPALRAGEQRLHIDGELCPDLREGLTAAMTWLLHWYYEPEHKRVQIEAKTMCAVPQAWRNDRAGQFFSGGIDSLATLRANRLNYPAEHPGSIKDGLLVYGLEVGTDYDEYEVFSKIYEALHDLAARGELTLIPVYTNLYRVQRDIDPDWQFWTYEFQGTALAAVAHAFTRSLDTVSIASTFDIANLQPWGSHPLLDPSYSSRDMRIRHSNAALSRLEKTALVADWDVALHHMRVCNRTHNYRPETFNCGRCEKCLRTMLGLLALGKLNQTTVFPVQDVNAELVDAGVRVHNPYVESCYRELLKPLAARGRQDLVRAVQKRIAIFHKRNNRVSGIRQFDRKYLKGSLSKVKNAVLRAAA